MRKSLASFALVGALLAPLSAATAQPAAETTVSRSQAEANFGVLLLFPCLTHVERKIPISELPEIYKEGLAPAPSDTKLPSGFKGVTGVWESKMLGSHLRVVELGPDKCIMIADQLPVDETLGHAALATTRLDPPFTVVGAKDSYWPVVYQTERTAAGRRIFVRLQGAEPGAPFHASRLSVLMAMVTGQPAP